MAFTYETTPELLAAELTKSVRGAIENAIMEQIRREAEPIMRAAASKMAGAIVAKVSAVQQHGPLGGELTVLLQINDGPRERVDRAEGW